MVHVSEPVWEGGDEIEKRENSRLATPEVPRPF
jgi:hypothetical protein